MENKSKDIPLTHPRQIMWIKIGGYFLASLSLVTIGAFGMWFYQAKYPQKTVPTTSPLVTPCPTCIPTKAPEAIGWETADGEVDDENKFTSNYYGFSIQFPLGWELNFNKHIRDASYILTAENNFDYYDIWIYVAKKGAWSLPGSTGMGSGEIIEHGSFIFLGQKLEKTAYVDQGKIEIVFYQSPEERSIVFENTDTLFFFEIHSKVNKERTALIPLSSAAESEFEAILSSFKLL